MLPFTAAVDLRHVERAALKGVEADNAALQRQGHRWVYEWGLTHLNSDAVKSALEALDGEIERDDTLRARELLYKLAASRGFQRNSPRASSRSTTNRSPGLRSCASSSTSLKITRASFR